MTRDSALDLPPLRLDDWRHTYMVNGGADFSLRAGGELRARWGGTYHYPPLSWCLRESGIRCAQQKLLELYAACKAIAQPVGLSFSIDDYRSPSGRRRSRQVGFEFRVIAEIPPDEKIIKLIQAILGANCGGLRIERLTSSHPVRQTIFAPAAPK